MKKNGNDFLFLFINKLISLILTNVSYTRQWLLHHQVPNDHQLNQYTRVWGILWISKFLFQALCEWASETESEWISTSKPVKEVVCEYEFESLHQYM